MNTPPLTKAITRAVLVALFLAVVGFSLLLAPEITGTVVVFSLLKGLLTVLFGWIFVMILSDTLVKSIVFSALEANASRKDGGILYHFLKPDRGELPADSPEDAKVKSAK